MSLSSLFNRILEEYRDTPPGSGAGRDHPLWDVFKETEASIAAAAPVASRTTISVNQGLGSGRSAEVPYFSILDSRVTTSTRRGVYCVYLFRQDMSGLYLTLNQGASENESKANVISAATIVRLRARAEELKSYADLVAASGFVAGSIDLRTKRSRGRQSVGLAYAAGAIASKFYAAGEVPNDQELVTDLGELLDVYDRYIDDRANPDKPSDGDQPSKTGSSGQVARTIEWLEKQTLWGRDELEELCESIRTDSSQLILAGPPGTGKTWVARHVAEHLTQGGQLLRTVQFHPSYAYEDFVVGLRPTATSTGAIQFQVAEGVVLQMVRDIDASPGPHILLIDEINRANLPKVLGELMYLFEYRGEAIRLQYGPDFRLPTTLRFLATMNTADRSIRNLDTALRRRFDIIECPPRRDILERYFKDRENGVTNLLDGFLALNDKLTTMLDRHHTIGHTFFMRSPMTRDELRRIWDRKIYPLVEEYFFDQPDQAAELKYELLWPPG